MATFIWCPSEKLMSAKYPRWIFEDDVWRNEHKLLTRVWDETEFPRWEDFRDDFSRFWQKKYFDYLEMHGSLMSYPCPKCAPKIKYTMLSNHF